MSVAPRASSSSDGDNFSLKRAACATTTCHYLLSHGHTTLPRAQQAPLRRAKRPTWWDVLLEANEAEAAAVAAGLAAVCHMTTALQRNGPGDGRFRLPFVRPPLRLVQVRDGHLQREKVGTVHLGSGIRWHLVLAPWPPTAAIMATVWMCRRLAFARQAAGKHICSVSVDLLRTAPFTNPGFVARLPL